MTHPTICSITKAFTSCQDANRISQKHNDSSPRISTRIYFLPKRDATLAERRTRRYTSSAPKTNHHVLCTKNKPSCSTPSTESQTMFVVSAAASRQDLRITEGLLAGNAGCVQDQDHGCECASQVAHAIFPNFWFGRQTLRASNYAKRCMRTKIPANR